MKKNREREGYISGGTVTVMKRTMRKTGKLKVCNQKLK